MLFTAPAFFISLTLASIEGVIAYAYYDSIGCDPLASGQIKNPNQVVKLVLYIAINMINIYAKTRN